jgi:hypothetical protein
MYNPIPPDFDWSSLYAKYDATCKRFDQNAPSLFAIDPKPRNDRHLYYALLDRIKSEKDRNGYIGLGTYEGILYWKLYSQPAAVKTVCSRIREDIALQKAIEKTLEKLGKQLPQVVSEVTEEVSQLYQLLHNHGNGLYGLSNACALPARSTFLHFLYPSTVPIFDKQVLLAVGVTEKDANKKQNVLFDYIPFAWGVSKNSYIPQGWQETPLRLVDMALWVIRNKQNRP